MKNFDPIFFTPPSGDTKRPRRLHKGGGGGDGGAAARKAAEDSRVASAINKINQVFGLSKATPETVDKAAFTKRVPIPGNNRGLGVIGMGFGQQTTPQYTTTFDKAGYDKAVAAAKEKADALTAAAAGRDQLYSTIGDDATNNALIDLNKDRSVTERDLNFMLARAGLSGGSRDVDVNHDILDTYQQGVLKASNLGLAAANNARSSDDKTRVNLINSIRAGLDEGSAMQQAYEGMRNNARAAQDDANSTSLAGFFDALKQQQQASAYNQGYDTTMQQYKKTPYSPAINGDRGRTNSY